MPATPQSPNGIELRDDLSPGVIVVRPAGDIDMSRSPELRAVLKSAHERKPERVIVDLESVEYMDSSGLATLVESMRTAKKNSVTMVICAMNDKVRAIFEIARLHQFFTIADSLDEALRA